MDIAMMMLADMGQAHGNRLTGELGECRRGDSGSTAPARMTTNQTGTLLFEQKSQGADGQFQEVYLIVFAVKQRKSAGDKIVRECRQGFLVSKLNHGANAELVQATPIATLASGADPERMGWYLVHGNAG
jgi:hypothetical protein